MDEKKQKRALLTGIAGCLLFMIGDYLYGAVSPAQSTETIGLMIKLAYLDMATWRMALSILCGICGTALYYIGFHQMDRLLSRRLCEHGQQKWLKGFRVAYMTGTVCWGYVHAMFMNTALIFKFAFEKLGDTQAAAEIANRVFYCNALPLVAAYIIGDGVLSVVMIVLVWKRVIPLKTTAGRILATLCNPIACAGIIGNLTTLMPFPFNQIDLGTESLGHALVLGLGLILLRAMQKDAPAQLAAR